MAYGRTSSVTQGDMKLRSKGLEGVGGRSMGTLTPTRTFTEVYGPPTYQTRRNRGRVLRPVRLPDQASYDFAFAGPQSEVGFTDRAARKIDRTFNPGMTRVGLTGNASDKSINQMGQVTSAAPMGQGQTSIGMTGVASEQSINERIDEEARLM